LKLLKSWDLNVIPVLSVKIIIGKNPIKRKPVVILIAMVSTLLLAKELARKAKLLLPKLGKVLKRVLLLLVFHALPSRDIQL
jgi:hypothetical protein